MTRAILYVATGPEYVAEATQSAASVHRACAEVRSILYTDTSTTSNLFSEIRALPNPTYSFLDKIVGMRQFDGDRGLFLDTDTLVFGSILPIFDLLERFDIVAAHASWRFSPALAADGSVVSSAYAVESIPVSFPDFNTGVIGFRNSAPIQAAFKRWIELYTAQLESENHRPANDQAAFRAALWESSLRVYTLPPEYNFRADFPGFVGSSVVIAHGRNPRLPAFVEQINRGFGARVFVPAQGKVYDSKDFEFQRRGQSL